MIFSATSSRKGYLRERAIIVHFEAMKKSNWGFLIDLFYHQRSYDLSGGGYV
jgi:hypothetical protein